MEGFAVVLNKSRPSMNPESPFFAKMDYSDPFVGPDILGETEASKSEQMGINGLSFLPSDVDWQAEISLCEKVTQAVFCCTQMSQSLSAISQFLRDIHADSREGLPQRLEALAFNLEARINDAVAQACPLYAQACRARSFQITSFSVFGDNVYAQHSGAASLLRFVASQMGEADEHRKELLIRNTESALVGSIRATAEGVKAAMAEIVSAQSFSSLSMPEFVRVLPRAAESMPAALSKPSGELIERYEFARIPEFIATVMYIDTSAVLRRSMLELERYLAQEVEGPLRDLVATIVTDLSPIFDLSGVDQLIEAANEKTASAAFMLKGIDPRLAAKLLERFFVGTESLDFVNRFSGSYIGFYGLLEDAEKPLLVLAAQLARDAQAGESELGYTLAAILQRSLNEASEVSPLSEQYAFIKDALGGYDFETFRGLSTDERDRAFGSLALKLLEVDDPSVQGFAVLYLASRRVPLDERCAQAIWNVLEGLREVRGYGEFLRILAEKIHPSPSHAAVAKLIACEAARLPAEERRSVDVRKCFAASFGGEISSEVLQAISQVSGIEAETLRFVHRVWSELTKCGVIQPARHSGASDWRVAPLTSLVSVAAKLDQSLLSDLSRRAFPITFEYAEALDCVPDDERERVRLFALYDVLQQTSPFDIREVLDRACLYSYRALDANPLVVSLLAGPLEKTVTRRAVGGQSVLGAVERVDVYADSSSAAFAEHLRESRDSFRLTHDKQYLARSLCALAESETGLDVGVLEAAIKVYVKEADETCAGLHSALGDTSRFYPELIELLTSADEDQRAVTRSLFTDGTISDLLLWSGAADVGFVQGTIALFCKEARARRLRPTDYAHFCLKHVIPALFATRPFEGERVPFEEANPLLRLILDVAAARCGEKHELYSPHAWIARYGLPPHPTIQFNDAMRHSCLRCIELGLSDLEMGAYFDLLAQLPAGFVTEKSAPGIVDSIHRSGISVERLASSSLLRSLSALTRVAAANFCDETNDLTPLFEELRRLLELGNPNAVLNASRDLLELWHESNRIYEASSRLGPGCEASEVRRLLEQYAAQEDVLGKQAVKDEFIRFVAQPRDPTTKAWLNEALVVKLQGCPDYPEAAAELYRIAKAVQEKARGRAPLVEELSIIRQFFSTFGICNTHQLYLTYRSLFLGLKRIPTLPTACPPTLALDKAGKQESREVQIDSVEDLNRYVKATSAEIVERPDRFVPTSLVDYEILGLASRVHRLADLNADEAMRVVQEAVEVWKHHKAASLDPFLDYDSSEYPVLMNSINLRSKTVAFKRIDPKRLRAFRATDEELRLVDLLKSEIVNIQRNGLAGEIEGLEQMLGLNVRGDEPHDFSGEQKRWDDLGHRARLSRLFGNIRDRIGEGQQQGILRKLFLLFSFSDRTHSASAGLILEAVDSHEVLCGFSELLYQSYHDREFEEILRGMDQGLVAALDQALGLVVLNSAVARLNETIEHATDKVTKLAFTPGRGAANGLIGFICDSCVRMNLATTPGAIFIPFCPVYGQEKERPPISNFQGGSILLAAKTECGEDALIVRGFNPIHTLLMKVRAGDLFEEFVAFVEEQVARPLGFRYILAPLDKIPGLAFSNRPLVHSYFNSTYRDQPRVRLQEPDKVTFNNISVDDRCVVVRDLGITEAESVAER